MGWRGTGAPAANRVGHDAVGRGADAQALLDAGRRLVITIAVCFCSGVNVHRFII
jgi:hypothetical protein